MVEVWSVNLKVYGWVVMISFALFVLVSRGVRGVYQKGGSGQVS